MSKNIKILIAVGGTGGHVFPGCYLAKHLINEKCEIKLVTDKRGYKYYENFSEKTNLSYKIFSYKVTSPSDKKIIKSIIYILVKVLE
mgnify:CR=1 FL=1